MPTVTNNKKRVFFYIVWLITAFGAYKVLNGYLSLIVISIMYSILVHPVYLWLTKKLRNNTKLASILTIIISFFIIVVPLILAGNLFVSEALRFKETVLFDGGSALTSVDRYVAIANDLTSRIPGINDVIDPKNIENLVITGAKNVSKFLVSKALHIGSSSVAIITDFFLFLIVVYFMIPKIPKLLEYIQKVSPLEDKIDRLYMDRATTMMITLVKGTFLIALVRGMFGGLFLWLAGVDFVFTLSLAMVILAVLPIIGTAFVTIPIGLFLLASGDIVGGSIILLGQIIVMSNVDNILRAELASRETPLHPALLLLSLIGGLQIFGFLGFIYGPVLMILFMTSMEIYLKHYKY